MLQLVVQLHHPQPNRGALAMIDIPYSIIHTAAKNTKTNGRVLVSLSRPEDCRPTLARHNWNSLGRVPIVESM